MPKTKTYPITVQIPIDPNLLYHLRLKALELGISNEEYRRQALRFAVNSLMFRKHMEKVYGK